MSEEKKNPPSCRESEADRIDEIESMGGTLTHGKGERIHCLSIIGQIEGHYALPEGQKATKYEHIIPLLVSIEEDDEVDGLLMILNTMGGDVEAGLAISEMVASMKKPSVSLVLGGGHSIGVPLATAARRSFIVPSATMTVHRASDLPIFCGNAEADSRVYLRTFLGFTRKDTGAYDASRRACHRRRLDHRRVSGSGIRDH